MLSNSRAHQCRKKVSGLLPFFIVLPCRRGIPEHQSCRTDVLSSCLHFSQELNLPGWALRTQQALCVQGKSHTALQTTKKVPKCSSANDSWKQTWLEPAVKPTEFPWVSQVKATPSCGCCAEGGLYPGWGCCRSRTRGWVRPDEVCEVPTLRGQAAACLGCGIYSSYHREGFHFTVGIFLPPEQHLLFLTSCNLIAWILEGDK